jgi:phosphoribosylanthranilate isomerase
MLVKICGITRQEDAERAVGYGAAALGFVFWPGSPRAIEPERARAIIETLPPFVTAVGVFVNQPCEYVNEVAVGCRLGAVQLHGDETVSYAAGMTRPVVKAIGLDEAEDDRIDSWPPNARLLLDVHDPVRHGGTGRTVDWVRAAEVARRRPVILAGGLRPDNVLQAIERVRPFGIDVSSGVEASPGIKDWLKLERLFDAVSNARPHPRPRAGARRRARAKRRSGRHR